MEDLKQEVTAEQTETTSTNGVTPLVGGRYKVSRKGMGGRKAKYDEALLKELLALQAQGTALLGECKRRGLPYVSINSAMKRLGLK